MARHRLALVLSLALGLLPALGVAGGAARLNGNAPRDRAPVEGLTLPEVHPGRPDTPFHFKAAPRHVLFVYFGYTTCPDACPTTLGDLGRALRDLAAAAGRVDVAFVTVDPQRDLPQMLAPYLASFVRGGHPLRPRTQEELTRVERAFGASSTVTRSPDGRVDVTHSAASYVVDDRGRIVDQWAFGTTPSAMASDLRVLLNIGEP